MAAAGEFKRGTLTIGNHTIEIDGVTLVSGESADFAHSVTRSTGEITLTGTCTPVRRRFRKYKPAGLRNRHERRAAAAIARKAKS